MGIYMAIGGGVVACGKLNPSLRVQLPLSPQSKGRSCKRPLNQHIIMTQEQKQEFAKIVNQVLPTFRVVESRNDGLTIYPDRPEIISGASLKMLINAINLFNGIFWIDAEIGKGLKVEVNII